MKKNFIVSALKALWIDKASSLFLIEPYVYYQLQKESPHEFSDIEVAPFIRKSREDLTKASRYVDEKYDKYIPILAARLNSIHNMNHSQLFWEKALSMALIRYITLAHDLFNKCEQYFDPAKHICNVLSPVSYYTPLDFEDQRYLFQACDYGQEQLFSLYMNTFYAGTCSLMELDVPAIEADICHDGIALQKKSWRKSLQWTRIVPEIKQSIKKLYYVHIIGIRRNMQIGILGSFFSLENIRELAAKSKKRIYLLYWDIIFDYHDKQLDRENREQLSAFDKDFDRFDRFFFSTLKYCMPRVFIEHYQQIEKQYRKASKDYKSLKYVTSENWISNTYVSIYLAVLQERGVKHINNEHNAFIHPYVGSVATHIAKLSDQYVTMGWCDSLFPNIIRGASLFPFTLQEKYEKKYSILYISGAAGAKLCYYSGLYGYDEENAPKYLKFGQSFFSALSVETLGEIAYRPYPKDYIIKLKLYDKEKFLAKYLKQMKSILNTNETCKVQMLKSRIIVVDYISTSYLEAMLMNIPVIFFWDRNAYYLKDEYADFFEPLTRVGICQTDPIMAAGFLEKIKDDPLIWWNSEKVQQAKGEFLRRNIGEPEVMMEYLLMKAN
ncbi:MAG TPA: hypothetical protein DCS13_04935 [Candidatus Margulisbacteria bacterium]|nr:MAG: hypothetical protein A2X43_00240 [Candidatus Margulisbacteria bacterium GWD2_39_127]HAR62790.1 hypothetical protein [Candidatus Margulisiibacteriota bacterium]